MDEYISREALLAEIAADHGNWIFSNDTDELYHQGVEDNYSDTIRLINEIPSADVQPVVHAKWEISSDGYYPYCSRCFGRPNGELTKYCPDCGARMDLKDGDAE